MDILASIARQDGLQQSLGYPCKHRPSGRAPTIAWISLQASPVRTGSNNRLDTFARIARQDGLQQSPGYPCKHRPSGRAPARAPISNCRSPSWRTIVELYASFGAVLTPILSLWDSSGMYPFFLVRPQLTALWSIPNLRRLQTVY